MSTPPALRPRAAEVAPDRSRRRPRLAAGPVIAILVLASLSLMLLDLRGGPTDLLRTVGAAVGGPLQAASDAVFGPMRTGEFRRGDVEQLRDEVARLSDSNRRLQAENDILSRELATAPAGEQAERAAAQRVEAAVAARVVAADPAVGAAAVTLDAGSDDGVVVDSPVLVAGGLVGRVTDVNPTTSSVLLIADPGSAVAVRLDDLTALVQGSGDRRAARLDHLDPLADVRVGQKVVTMGSDDGWPYPAGIPVGTVRSITGDLGELDRSVTVEPAAPLSALDNVIVLTRPDDSARSVGGSS